MMSAMPFRKLTTAASAAFLSTSLSLIPLTSEAQSPSPPQSSQSVTFPTTTLQTGMHLIEAEVADTQPRRMQGLMYRRDLPGNKGMVFVFEQADAHCMWMKNTLIPLTVAFMDDSGAILNLADMQPQSEANHCARGKARFALEMRQGWFAAKGIRAGDRIAGVERLTPR